MHIPRLEVQEAAPQLRQLHPIHLHDPMRHHIHARARPARRPKLAVHHPLRIRRPLHLGIQRHGQRHDPTVRRRAPPIQNPARRHRHGARARRKQRLARRDVGAHELVEALRDRLERVRAPDEEVVERRAGVAGRRRHGAAVAGEEDGVEVLLADVEEFDVDGLVGAAGREELFAFEGAVERRRDVGEDVDWAGDVEDLVFDH